MARGSTDLVAWWAINKSTDSLIKCHSIKYKSQGRICPRNPELRVNSSIDSRRVQSKLSLWSSEQNTHTEPDWGQYVHTSPKGLVNYCNNIPAGCERNNQRRGGAPQENKLMGNYIPETVHELPSTTTTLWQEKEEGIRIQWDREKFHNSPLKLAIKYLRVWYVNYEETQFCSSQSPLSAPFHSRQQTRIH